MHVHSRLPRSLPNIYPNVESVGRMLGKRELLSATKKLENRDLLLGRHFEEIGYVTFWNNENVATTQRMVVRTHIGEFVLGQD